MKVRLPPIGFWSYARQDDESSRGRLSSLRSLLQSELQQQYGRDPIQIFQDVSAIPPGAEWQASITSALDNTTFFIPIITPAFIQSQWCCEEFMIFLAREKALRAQHPQLRDHSRIFPISYLSIENMDDAHDPAVLEELHRRQSLDFRALRLKDYQQEAVSLELAKLAAKINQLLSIRVEAPPTEEEKAELAARRAAEQKQIEAAAARVADEAAIAKAEEERAAQRKRDMEVLEKDEKNDDVAPEPEPAPKPEPPIPPPPTWLQRHWRRLAAGAVVAVIAILALNAAGKAMKAERTKDELARWGLSPRDWAIADAQAIFDKGKLTERVAELHAAADRREPIAQTLMGYVYINGAGADQNPYLGNTLLTAAAKQGEPRAQYKLGDQYAGGQGMPAADDKAALRWYRRSAAQHFPFGQANVGYFYELGRGGLSKDPKAAVKWYRLAADQGLAGAQNNLANLIEQGDGVPAADKVEAAKYYRLAADQSYPQAQSRLADFYLRGWGGLPQDDAQAEKLYRLAAAQGSGRAAYVLGWMYAKGERGAAHDDSLALEWCKKAVAATIDTAGPEAQACVDEANKNIAASNALTSQFLFPTTPSPLTIPSLTTP